jgi:hypothetical protein
MVTRRKNDKIEKWAPVGAAFRQLQGQLEEGLVLDGGPPARAAGQRRLPLAVEQLANEGSAGKMALDQKRYNLRSIYTNTGGADFSHIFSGENFPLKM